MITFLAYINIISAQDEDLGKFNNLGPTAWMSSGLNAQKTILSNTLAFLSRNPTSAITKSDRPPSALKPTTLTVLRLGKEFSKYMLFESRYFATYESIFCEDFASNTNCNDSNTKRNEETSNKE